MKDRPAGVSDEQLAAAVAAGWGLDVRAVRYRPVGFGSYHWAVDAGRPLFVTVDAFRDDPVAGLRRLRRAFDTALALRRDAGLEFVVAPLPAGTGETVLPLGARHSVAVFPQVSGEAGEFGRHRDEDAPAVLELLVRLHAATVHAPRTELVLPGRDRLDGALRTVDRPWTGGPYTEPLRALLARRAGRIGALLSEFDHLVEQVRGGTGGWVVTHGEPHPGNVVRGPDGPRLIDWDTVQLAPPERDLWLLDRPDLHAEYTRRTGRPVSAAALALYRLWWELADVAGYVTELCREHETTADTTAAWTYLNRYLA
ncbi:phosphotransferase [Actinocatenispora sera]|jgi:spectinomycin phosphotransferase|uniref:Aminoglycoside phosphotransferase domain-containing protein n=1 Tax=Actinocatenispora sera TaxID=390989 RepID=A0A810L7K9_9ACTN|nr:phosphotransferase [Actinocatenispora sera]BCJ31550.1 hypothetical protein Asera_56580 [Actinocatenispora sera]